MPEPSQNATIVFKIADAQSWALASERGIFSGSSDDARDGYIHLSTARQVPGTLAKHFRNQSNLLLIAVDASTLGEWLKWEPSRDNELFPHLYKPLPTTNILWVKPLTLGNDGVPVAPEDD